jgi:hypothetical protein
MGTSKVEDRGGSDDEDGEQGDGSTLALLEPRHEQTAGNPLKLWPQMHKEHRDRGQQFRSGFFLAVLNDAS